MAIEDVTVVPFAGSAVVLVVCPLSADVGVSVAASGAAVGTGGGSLSDPQLAKRKRAKLAAMRDKEVAAVALGSA